MTVIIESPSPTPPPSNLANLHALPISARPRRTWTQSLNAVAFGVVFNLGCVLINVAQFVLLLPLRVLHLVPFGRRLYDAGIRRSKGAFGTLLVAMCSWFAPTNLVITFETKGPGKITQKELEKLVKKDSKGNVSLNLPTKSVLIANHQIYADWWYAWCLTYFMNTHRDVYIVLKRSLKWVPIVGWGMQFYNFIFLARSWASDRRYLVNRLAWLGKRAQEQDIPLTFILYPEGTLVSPNTRPISKKYADKMGIPDMAHTLMPRSTGLHHSLRALAPRISNLKVIDVTMAYPGIPEFKYGQSYYTLRSIFFDRIPPPAVHMHVRVFDVSRDVPIGDISATNPDVLPQNEGEAVEAEVPETEKEVFDGWLKNLWREKDSMMVRYLETGSFAEEGEKEVVIPVKLRSKWEALTPFGFFIPDVVGWAQGKVGL
ncbi:acyltransferase-domain-containing protein [Thelephora ganbajun]|uniref:Acyltransferase-domain-containing protein n=1 Tax=Thelephora ganbajun TaxID=370292 RepID=A0ACB6ZM90_THEGA|nr:acyltransferase-domain-containing protein [Thelephora ganbajun]